MLGAEVGEQVDQETVAKRGRCRQLDQARDIQTRCRHRALAVEQHFAHLLGVAQVESPRIRQAQTSCRALQQAHAECRLEVADLLADVGLGDLQLVGGTRETAKLGNQHKAQGLIKPTCDCFH